MNQASSASDPMDTIDLRRARELLPWFVQEQLAGDDQAFMTHWLENTMPSNPTLAAQWQLEVTAEQAWLRSTRTQLQAAAQAQAAQQAQPATEQQGLAALMLRIAQSREGLVASANKSTNVKNSLDAIDSIANNAMDMPANSQNSLKETVIRRGGYLAPSWPERIATWMADTLGVRSPAIAFGVAALVLAQAGVIGALLLDKPAQQVPLSGDAPAAAPANQVLLTVAFSPQTTELAMRAALTAAGAQLVSGPSALGLYSVAVPLATAQDAVNQLRAAKGVVDSVQR